MPYLGSASRLRLETVHSDLQRWTKALIFLFDFTVVCGHRSEEDQNQAVEDGTSLVSYPDSYHNFEPSLAIDLAPWDQYRGVIDWDHPRRFILLAGMGLQLAHEMVLPIVWGGDWDSDTFMRDHRFKDYPHYQLPRDWNH